MKDKFQIGILISNDFFGAKSRTHISLMCLWPDEKSLLFEKETNTPESVVRFCPDNNVVKTEKHVSSSKKFPRTRPFGYKIKSFVR